MIRESEKWDIEITSQNKLLDLNLKSIWNYRDLLFLLVRRDIVSFYKQTIFGAAWYFIQPIFTTVVYIFIFGNLAGLSTDGLPQPLFYIAGVTAWNYFAECLNKTSTVFKDNQAIFGKVYFPRIIMPLSIVISNLLKYFIQISLFIGLIIYYLFKGNVFHVDWTLVLFPYFILLMALQGLGLGMIVTSMTIKYKDLVFVLTFGIQLMMYATTVIYPLSSLGHKMYWLVALNPMTFVIEGIRRTTLGVGVMNGYTILYTTILSFLLLLIGLLIFNKAEKNFIDKI